MASIWKVSNSPFFICQFRDATGTRLTRSTKQRKQSEARKVAEAYEAAARTAGRHELTRAAATKILDELMMQAGLGTFKEESIADFLGAWHRDREKIGKSPATFIRYKSQIGGLISFLGSDRAKGSIASLSAAELEAWRDAEKASGKAPKTVNFAVATIRAALESAKRKGLVLSNQADAVEKDEGRGDTREPFTAAELVALMQNDNLEWRGMIVLGAHTGIRITDASNLTWASADLDKGILSFSPTKTQRTNPRPLNIAMHSELVATLRTLGQGVGNAPIFPSLYGQKPGSSGGLSNQFATIMAKAGVIVTLGAKKTGKGRQTRSKGFHSFRHTMISRMADAGISADVRKAIAGHSSDAIHQKYTHLDIKTQQAAVAKMGGIAGQ